MQVERWSREGSHDDDDIRVHSLTVHMFNMLINASLNLRLSILFL